MNRRDLLRAAGGLAGGWAVDSSAGPTPTSAATAAAESASQEGREGTFAPLASLPVEAAREAVVGPDEVTVFVAVEDGFAVVDVAEAAEPRLLAERRELLPDADDGPLGQVQEVAVDGDRLLVMGPAHPDPAAVKAALLHDVADPADPRLLAVHRTDYPIHNGELVEGRAYLTANAGGESALEIVGMEGTGGGGEPTVLGRWSLEDADPAWADVHPALRPLHDVTVRDGVAYCSCWDAGTWLVDVGDASAPRALGQVGGRSASALADVAEPRVENTELPGNHHSTAVDGDLVAVGREAWDADGDGRGGPGGITLFDVSSPDAPERLADVPPPPTTDPSLQGVWTTAHNFDLVDGTLYSAWYQGGVRVHDVSDARSPRPVAAWRESATTRFWTARRARDSVVATSTGTAAGEPGLYVFPPPDPGGQTATRTPGATPSPPGTPTHTAPPVTATPGLAGFGVPVTLLAGGLAWYLARRRRG